MHKSLIVQRRADLYDVRDVLTDILWEMQDAHMDATVAVEAIQAVDRLREVIRELLKKEYGQ